MKPEFSAPGVRLYKGNCLDVLRGFSERIDITVADPPYGCGKADWDYTFPTAWYSLVRALSRTVVVITGSSGLYDSVPLVGDNFVDVIAAWNKNGMTRGPLGYGNWLAAVITGEKPRMGQNFFSFAVSGDKPDHPTPKPLEYMIKLIKRVSNEGDVILDPFMGSGTCGVACVKTGRDFVGIELKPEYFDMSCGRIADAIRTGRQLAFV